MNTNTYSFAEFQAVRDNLVAEGYTNFVHVGVLTHGCKHCGDKSASTFGLIKGENNVNAEGAYYDLCVACMTITLDDTDYSEEED